MPISRYVVADFYPNLSSRDLRGTYNVEINPIEVDTVWFKGKEPVVFNPSIFERQNPSSCHWGDSQLKDTKKNSTTEVEKDKNLTLEIFRH